MGVFSRHVDGTVLALSWRRTVVVEQGRWHARRTAWKPHGDNVRNIRAVQVTEDDIVGAGYSSGPRRQPVQGSRTHAVRTEHTYFEYEEHQWHHYRSFTGKGDSTAGVSWPGYTLGADERVSERRETYRATFSADAGELQAELDEATWRTLKAGRKCRLKVSASGEVKKVTAVRR